MSVSPSRPAPHASAAPTADLVRQSPSSNDDEEQDRLLCERYRAWAPAYDRAFASYSETTLAKAMQFIGTPLPRRILDLACGTGLLGERLLREDASVHLIGIDRSREMLDRARARLVPHGNVTLLVGRAEQLPLASRSVDAVVVANAFHLLADPHSALAECRRVLAPSGRIVIVDWCRDALAMRALSIVLRRTQRLRRQIRGVATMSELLAASDFTGIRAERFSARPLWGLMALSAVRRA